VGKALATEAALPGKLWAFQLQSPGVQRGRRLSVPKSPKRKRRRIRRATWPLESAGFCAFGTALNMCVSNSRLVRRPEAFYVKILWTVLGKQRA